MKRYYFPKINRSAERQHSMNIRTEKILNQAQSGDDKNDYGRTALHLAAENGNLTALTTLIKAGADVDRSTSWLHKNTPVMMASRGGHLRCLQALIKAGARLDDLNRNGKPPLLLAKNLQCFQALIEGGACVNQRTWNGAPIITLVRNGEEMQALLKAGAEVHLTYNDGKTDLMYNSEIYITKRLLSLGLNPNTQDKSGKTALMHACVSNSHYIHAILPILLEAGADMDITDHSGRTVLMMAAEAGKSLTVEILLQFKADPNKKNKYGKTALMYAKNVDCIHMLISKGADVNVTDKDGKTALMYPAETHIIKTLLSLGLNLNTQDKNGKTALMYACEHISCNNNNTILPILLEAGADVDITDYSGRTALMMAAETGNSPNIEKILQFKADPNKKDKDGKTALMYAKDFDCMKVLISQGVDVNVRDNSQCTSLDYKLQELASQLNSTHLHYDFLFSVIYSLLLLLNSGSQPVINVKYRHYLVKIFLSDIIKSTSKVEISDYHKQLIRLLVCNGIVGLYPEAGDRFVSPVKSVVKLALHHKQVDVLKYLIANCYLTLEDLADMRATLMEVRTNETLRQVLQRKRKHDHQWSRVSLAGRSPEEMMKQAETQELLLKAMDQPWPLVKLAFIAVSSALGLSPGREERIPKTGLPDRLQRMLMFQEPVSRLPVSKWKYIPLTFDPVEYEKLPKPRPLLYYWPVGRQFQVKIIKKNG